MALWCSSVSHGTRDNCPRRDTKEWQVTTRRAHKGFNLRYNPDAHYFTKGSTLFSLEMVKR